MTTDGEYLVGQWLYRFQCAGCGQHYYADAAKRPEMQKEFASNYGHAEEETDEELVSVCDACYAEVMAHNAELSRVAAGSDHSDCDKWR